MKKRSVINQTRISFPSFSSNEAFARAAASSFVAQLNPTYDELSDIKCAISEAVTNAIVHGYPDTIGEVTVFAEITDNDVHIVVSDSGIGIDDVNKALEPFYTTRPNDERSGMGFTIIKTFMDEVKVVSKPNSGTVVDMLKTISKSAV